MSVLLVTLALLTGGDTLRTEVMFLSGMPVERAIALWERVLGPAPEAAILPGKSADMVVVRDTPARIQRFRALIAALSGGGGGAARIYVRPVRHVAPSELAALLDEVLTDRLRDVVLVPDDRSGRLVVKATPKHYQAIDRLARTLDVPPRGGQRRVIGVEPEPEGGLPP